jgi:hypothetical protein
MSPVDKLNLAGIILTGSGSTVAMSGAYMQMNGYFAFKPGKLLRNCGESSLPSSPEA